MQMFNLDVLSMLVYSNVPQRGAEPPAAGGNGGVGRSPQPLGDFW